MSDLSNTDKLANALASLVRRKLAPPGDTSLRGKAIKTTIPSQRGESRVREGGAGAGISSPLTETDTADRTYYATVGELVSSDGLIIVELQALHTIDFSDARNREVQIILQDPNA